MIVPPSAVSSDWVDSGASCASMSRSLRRRRGWAAGNFLPTIDGERRRKPRAGSSRSGGLGLSSDHAAPAHVGDCSLFLGKVHDFRLWYLDASEVRACRFSGIRIIIAPS